MADLGKLFSAAHRTSSVEGEDAEAMRSRESRSQFSTGRLRAMASKIMTKVGSGQTDVSIAMGRSHDPMWYWKNNNIIFDIATEPGLVRLREFCREVYQSHPYIPSVIDIYSKYPLIQMELQCKDEQLAEWYTELFYDDLNYEDFLVDVLREYWTVGEAFPWGSFNDLMGVWESDELLNPDDVRVIRSPLLPDTRFLMRLPESLRTILYNQSPAWEYRQLIESSPELRTYMGEDAWFPVSNVLLRQIKFSVNSFHPRGLPILLRAMRPLIQEEMLNSAQDAIADRLYTPLLIAKIGASAADLGTDDPWIPTQGDLRDFEAAFDTALAADFRLLTTHFATSLESVLGRETMPDFSRDFDRILDRELGVFGISKTMLTGADQGQTYAADALHRDLMSQLLIKAQRFAGRFMQDRMKVVAEAQEHYDYTLKGGKRIPIMEEALDINPETGEERIIEQPKLLIPTIKFKSMNMKEDENLHQFLESLAAAGAPISYKTRFTNLPVDIEDEAEMKADEDVALAKLNQETRKRIYMELRNEGLPIPADLKADFDPPEALDESKVPGAQGEGAHQPTEGEDPPPMLGTVPLAPTDTLAPTPDDYKTKGQSDIEPAQPEKVTLPRNRLHDPDSDQRHRPPESDEQRADMPKASNARTASVDGEESLPGFSEVDDAGGEEGVSEGAPEEMIEGPMMAALREGPHHVGRRRLRVQAARERVNEDPSQVPYNDEAPTYASDRAREAEIESWSANPFLGVPSDDEVREASSPVE